MVLRYHGNFLLSIGAETVAAAEAEELAELLITIGASEPIRAYQSFHLLSTFRTHNAIHIYNLTAKFTVFCITHHLSPSYQTIEK